MAPAYLELLGGEVSSVSWRLISPWEDALIPVTHSLEEFKATRWRGVSAIAGFRVVLLFCSDN